LSAAKAAKNDEFYTQYYDIERVINAYLEFDQDVFRGKIVLLPCDDPEWPEETHFHIIRAGEQEIQETPYQPSLFEQEAPQFDPHKTSGRDLSPRSQ